MNTDTTTQENIIDLAALRLDLLALLGRAEEALMFTPDAATAGEYAEQLYNLNEDIQHAAYALAHARPALRMVSQAGRRLAERAAGLGEVFRMDSGLDDELTSDIGERVFWGDIAPVFPELRMDYSPEQPDDGIPF
jgi:hypothetical protein